jgi:hypothetical protein
MFKRRMFDIMILTLITVITVGSQNLIYLEGKDIISDEETFELILTLKNADTIRAFQMTMKINKPFIKLERIEKTSESAPHLFNYYSPNESTTNMVFLSDGSDGIPPGRRKLLIFKFKVLNRAQGDSVRIRFENNKLVGLKGKKLNIDVRDKIVKFASVKFEVKFNLNSSSLIAILKNPKPVYGLKLQLELEKSAQINHISLMPRAAEVMWLDYKKEGKVLRVELSSKDGSALDAGDGEIFIITGNFNEAGFKVKDIKITGSNGSTVVPSYELSPQLIYPSEFKLDQNYPNPFNPVTTIKFSIPEDTRVHIAIFDMSGRLVRILIDDYLPAGEHAVIWDGTDNRGSKVSSGIYIYRMIADNFVSTKRMILMK